MIEVLKTVQVEMRLTVGQSWDNQFFQCRGPLLSNLSGTDYKYRGCENHFSRNILMFNESLEHVNLRVTFGASRDFDCDTSQIKGLQSVTVGNNLIKVAPDDYYSHQMALNSLPMGWFNHIMGHSKDQDMLSPEKGLEKLDDKGKKNSKSTSPNKVTFSRAKHVPRPPLVKNTQQYPVIVNSLEAHALEARKPPTRPKQNTPQRHRSPIKAQDNDL